MVRVTLFGSPVVELSRRVSTQKLPSVDRSAQNKSDPNSQFTHYTYIHKYTWTHNRIQPAVGDIICLSLIPPSPLTQLILRGNEAMWAKGASEVLSVLSSQGCPVFQLMPEKAVSNAGATMGLRSNFLLLKWIAFQRCFVLDCSCCNKITTCLRNVTPRFDLHDSCYRI